MNPTGSLARSRVFLIVGLVVASSSAVHAQSAQDLINQMRDLRNHDWGGRSSSSDAEDRAEARADAQEIRRAHSYNSNLHAGNEAWENNDVDGLEQAARAMLQGYPGDRIGLEFLGRSFALRGDFNRGSALYQSALNAGMKKSRWRMLMNRLKDDAAFQQLQNGDPAGAEVLIREALQFDDKDDWAWDMLGAALTRQGRFDEALRYYQQAIKINPQEASYLKHSQWVQAEKSSVEAREAYKWADRAVAAIAVEHLRMLANDTPEPKTLPPALPLAGPDQPFAPVPWTDASVVDLRGTPRSAPSVPPLEKTFLTPDSAKRPTRLSDLQLAPPPDPRMVPPVKADMEFLFPEAQQPASLWPGPKRPANEPKLVPSEDPPREMDLPKDSDIDFLFPGYTAGLQNQLMMDGLFEIAVKEQVSKSKASPPVVPDKPDPLSVDKSPYPHN